MSLARTDTQKRAPVDTDGLLYQWRCHRPKRGNERSVLAGSGPIGNPTVAPFVRGVLDEGHHRPLHAERIAGRREAIPETNLVTSLPTVAPWSMALDMTRSTTSQDSPNE